MFIADRLLKMSTELKGHSMIEGGESTGRILRAADRILEGFELFTFERSALHAGSDLRIDTPDRFEQVASAVFDRPRRVFMEARQIDRQSCLAGMKGFPTILLKPGLHDPERVGIAVDVKGEGRARIDVLWSFSPRKHGLKLDKRTAPGISAEMRKAMTNLAVVGFGLHHIEIDLSRKTKLSRADFEAAARSTVGRPENIDACLRSAATILEERGAPIKGRSEAIIHEAWRLMRINDICTVKTDQDALRAARETAEIRGVGVDHVLMEAGADMDGEIIYAIAMLALLEARSEEIVKRPRDDPQPAQRSRRRSEGNDAAHQAKGLSIISMRLDNETDAALYQSTPGEPLKEGGKARTRHVVRGHLFRARNGHLVYRKRHWRGSLAGKRIHRVI
jgi:hypothetical protein